MMDWRRPGQELSFRSKRILYATITEFIATGEPVGSRRLAQRYGINLSPASVRNVLADLEEAGYLIQPHTSAGRVPTDLGFRVFVDALMQVQDVHPEHRQAVLAKLSSNRPGKDSLLREVANVLSALTGVAAVVVAPRIETQPLAHLHFVPIRPDAVLAVLVSTRGDVEHRVVATKVSTTELEQVHNYLEGLLEGRTLAEIRDALVKQMDAERDNVEILRKNAADLVEAALAEELLSAKVLIAGQTRLFDRPEFSDVDKLRAYLKAFRERENVLELVERTLASKGVQVLIGAEAELGELHDISFVSANYGKSGALGVIGPTRMDYPKIIPLVGFTAQVLHSLFVEKSGEEPAAQNN